MKSNNVLTFLKYLQTNLHDMELLRAHAQRQQNNNNLDEEPNPERPQRIRVGLRKSEIIARR